MVLFPTIKYEAIFVISAQTHSYFSNICPVCTLVYEIAWYFSIVFHWLLLLFRDCASPNTVKTSNQNWSQLYKTISDKNELGPTDNKASQSHIYNSVTIKKISSINVSSHTWFATSHLTAHAKPFEVTSHIETNVITWVIRFSSRQSASKFANKLLIAISLVCCSYSVSITMYRLIFD